MSNIRANELLEERYNKLLKLKKKVNEAKVVIRKLRLILSKGKNLSWKKYRAKVIAQGWEVKEISERERRLRAGERLMPLREQALKDQEKKLKEDILCYFYEKIPKNKIFRRMD